MKAQAGRQIEQELDLIGRFARSYQPRFSILIQELNTHPTPDTVAQSLRLCVEAVNMLLDAQQRMASALKLAV